MLEALIITLREGIEAALVVGIIVSFLRREGEPRQLRAVWAGLATAVGASFLGAWWLRSWAVNEEAVEGFLYVSSAVLVGGMLIWMWRNGHRISQGMTSSLARITSRGSATAVFGGLFLFTFLMVVREGVETVLFLAAVSLTTTGLATLLGAFVGLGLAVWFGILFVRGSLRIDLGRFLKVTAIALGIFVIQLLVNGYHELAEAHWLPANPTSMRIVGPLVAHEFFFVAAIVALPLLAIAMPGGQRRRPAAATEGAEARLSRHRQQRQLRSRVLAGALGMGILCILGFGFAYGSEPDTSTPVTPVVLGEDGTVRIALMDLADGDLHHYAVTLEGVTVRFVALQIEPGRVVTALDACIICGPEGYYQQGPEIICRNCASAIYPPSIGQPGGCNPIPLAARIEGSFLIVDAEGLVSGKPAFQSAAAHHHAS